jgi:ATP-dependent Clp protease ATP-binding subunit ClpC
VFHQLTKDEIVKIARNMLAGVAERLKGLDIGMTADDGAVDKLAEEGFDPVYGARPLRRKIQSAVEDAIAEKMLEGKVTAGGAVKVTTSDGKIDIVAEEAPAECAAPIGADK